MAHLLVAIFVDLILSGSASQSVLQFAQQNLIFLPEKSLVGASASTGRPDMMQTSASTVLAAPRPASVVPLDLGPAHPAIKTAPRASTDSLLRIFMEAIVESTPVEGKPRGRFGWR